MGCLAERLCGLVGPRWSGRWRSRRATPGLRSPVAAPAAGSAATGSAARWGRCAWGLGPVSTVVARTTRRGAMDGACTWPRTFATAGAAGICAPRVSSAQPAIATARPATRCAPACAYRWLATPRTADPAGMRAERVRSARAAAASPPAPAARPIAAARAWIFRAMPTTAASAVMPVRPARAASAGHASSSVHRTRRCALGHV